MTRISEIFDIPTRVHQGDFVLKLTEGVDRADETLRNYVVTPQLVRSFDQALSLIQSAVAADSSKGAYLHGSFGSGKSHFMAVLSLLLAGHPVARGIPELAGVVTRHNSWIEGRRFLLVPYHLIGATSLESAVLGQYAEHVRKLHPDAPTPGFYRAERLFEDARRLRASMGDEAFFARLGAASAGGDSGWGALETAWDAVRFEAALDAAPGSEERTRLVGDLVDSFFGSARELARDGGDGFVSLDEGLVVLARHARGLGYDAVVLFLDELILWLASHAADLAFISREGQKVVKLVEAGMSGRPIPIISFIARQRDLRELVGEHVPGAEQLGFADVLNYWQARFDEITLEDRNLPAIIEKRLLRPKSPDAERQLAEKFEATARIRDEVMNTLLTREGDRQMFRQVYPFSPALVQTLIAISALLQRERTALKLLLQLLVDQRDTLELGDIVPVGDLFDVIESGDEPFTQAMRIRFDQARKLWRQKLLPMLEEEHGLAWTEIEAGQIDDPARIRVFRNDARLLKTLVLAALADGVEALRGLTPARLAALNHGTVRSPIPGAESQAVLQKLRGWAARVGEIKVADDGPNPVVSLQLVGVNTEEILENAKGFDNHGTRVQKVRALLHELLGIKPDESLLAPTHRMLWRGSWWECEILFRNVRELPPESFKPQHAPWRVIIDFPFDQRGYAPTDDVAVLNQVKEVGERHPTIVWLPSFLAPAAQEELGRLVVLDHVLTHDRLDEYGAHLSQLDREQARAILANQRAQIRQRVVNFLRTAYGISTQNPEAVVEDTLESPFATLFPGLQLQPPVGAGFRECLDHLFTQALDFQFASHPRIEGEVRAAGLRKALEAVRRAAEAQDGRYEVNREDREEVRRVVVPLQLGRMGEAHVVLERHWVQEFEQKRARDQVTRLTVGRLRRWINEPANRGMRRELENLIIITYAIQTNRSFHLHGAAIEPSLERLDDELELREQSLPDEQKWQEAVERAASVFGIAVSPLRSATNLARLEEQVHEAVQAHRSEVERYAKVLDDRFRQLGLDAAPADRLRTARASRALVAAVAGEKGETLVNALADAILDTSAEAVAECIRKSGALTTALNATQWELFDAVEQLTDDAMAARAREIVARVRDALQRDEHVTGIAGALGQAQRDAVNLLREAATRATRAPEIVTGAVAGSESGPAAGAGQGPDSEAIAKGQAQPGTDTEPPATGEKRRRVAAAALDDAISELRRDVAAAEGGEVELSWRIIVRTRP